MVVAVNRADVRLSTNTRLFIDEGDDESTGSVTITAINDNEHTGEREVTVSGTLEPASSDIDVEDVKITITDDDVPSRAGEVDPYAVSDCMSRTTRRPKTSPRTSVLTATLVGGTTFDDDVTIAVTINSVAPPLLRGAAPGTLTIPAGSK